MTKSQGIIPRPPRPLLGKAGRLLKNEGHGPPGFLGPTYTRPGALLLVWGFPGSWLTWSRQQLPSEGTSVPTMYLEHVWATRGEGRRNVHLCFRQS